MVFWTELEYRSRNWQEQYETVQHLELEAVGIWSFYKNVQNRHYITHVRFMPEMEGCFHANPIGFADLNTNFWKEHFVCIGRVSMPST